MKLLALGAIGLGASIATAAVAQTSGAMAPRTRTVITPVAPPATALTRVGPNAFVVTPIPGIATATRIRIQKFSDYDLNDDGAYTPMEFAQALYFVATSDPVAGNPTLPADDRFNHRGAPRRMAPHNAVALLNATADEFATADTNGDWRVSPGELTALGM